MLQEVVRCYKKQAASCITKCSQCKNIVRFGGLNCFVKCDSHKGFL